MSTSRRPRLLLSAFLMNTTSHILGGQWRHPEAQQHRFNELKLWVDLAKDLEAARFDAIFLADVVGLYGDHDGGWASHIKRGLQVPSNDPLVLASALAGVTEEIGLAFTSSVIQSDPFQLARQLSTLDHLSSGRVAWNIVTSVLENSHRNFGADRLAKHTDRYDWAEEYVQAAFKLWEGSWEDGALLADKIAGIHADPALVNKIYHRGERYSIDGPHLSSPSPQRTPFLFQAGSSPRGRSFAAANAEATFLFAPNPENVRKNSEVIRKLAVDAGREASDVKIFAGLSFVVGSTEAEVLRKQADYDEYLDLDAVVAHIGGGLGIDLGGRPLDTRLGEIDTEGGKGVLEAIRASVPGGNPTIADLARYRAKSMQISGTPEQIVDQLELWQDAGTDGINIINQILPGSYTDFIEGVVPELRARGLAQTEYAPGTLREKVFGRQATLEASHPAAAFRGAFTQFSAANENLAAVTASS
ncbi:NtaA/DmoA family FMN-dependent monooxygenase [Paeniglutamicibacter sulfureus]|uniref:FMN-dependent oxidoreductase (Nitrilotriacetate monooxygenase family) n=1 Tax=Paeniglutamicibacter sulfureus TaxID=43666 RepID=A0ABU2BHT3_9MICC|nr:NtaA/DmoA family FMN-dependent monooxygenase [Paeniglutamicibacter sulfureus]MDR7358180.1 FMN-dependent oxidoreductase (nitrilotriacetate monooxygenase family) [Paeniglutamicibacter sulfureus]